MAANLTIKQMTAMYNVAAVLLDEEPIKSFKDSPTAQRRLDEALEKLKPAQKAIYDPDEELSPPREGSIKHLLVTMLDVDTGVSGSAVVLAVADFYKKKGSDNPPSLSSLLGGIRAGNGYGYRRIGDQYWLVKP